MIIPALGSVEYFIYKSTMPEISFGMDVWAGYEQGRRSRSLLAAGAAARINIERNGGGAVVKNDVGPTTVAGKEGIASPH